MRTLCRVVLAFEAIVIGLAIPVAINVEGMAPTTAVGIWGGMALAALVLAGLQRFTWGYYAGWVLQVLFLLSSFLISMMIVAAVVFVSLWVVAVVMGSRVEQAQAAHAARVEAEEEAAGAEAHGADGAETGETAGSEAQDSGGDGAVSTTSPGQTR